MYSGDRKHHKKLCFGLSGYYAMISYGVLLSEDKSVNEYLMYTRKILSLLKVELTKNYSP